MICNDKGRNEPEMVGECEIELGKKEGKNFFIVESVGEGEVGEINKQLEEGIELMELVGMVVEVEE